jgi:hypothetical protein
MHGCDDEFSTSAPMVLFFERDHGTHLPGAGASKNRVSQPSPFAIEYKGVQIARGYVVDLLIEDSLIVEIKSVDKLLPIHSAQLMTYMRLQGVSLAF